MNLMNFYFSKYCTGISNQNVLLIYRAADVEYADISLTLSSTIVYLYIYIYSQYNEYVTRNIISTRNNDL